MMYLCLALPAAAGVQKLAVFLLMLSILVVLHEYGHFLIARLCRVRVNDFAVGFGPTLLKWTSPRSGTNYRVNVLPLGGYCAMQGEDGKLEENVLPEQGGSFQIKTPWQRLAIVLAGPIANFILAFAIFVVSALAFGVPGDTFAPTIGQVLPGSPGARAGLEFGDRVLAVDGVAVDGETMVRKIQASAGVALHFHVLRNGETRELLITPKLVRDEQGKMVSRVGFGRVQAYRRVAPLAAVQFAARQFDVVFRGTVDGIAQLLTNPIKHYGNAVGIIGMERAASALQDLGWGPYFGLAASISIALGIFNLLPIPALDGGRALFILVELLRGRPVDPEREAFVHVAGFALLMTLMIFIAWHDIANIVSGKGVF
jgi:regulator of sigma E protease